MPLIKSALKAYIFTEEDVVSCWEYYKSYLVNILNKDYTIETAREDLFSLIGSKYDCRKKEGDIK